MSLDSRPWGLHPRGKGGWWIWDRETEMGVIGWVDASLDPEINWQAFDQDPAEPVASDCRSLSAAAEALWQSHLAQLAADAGEPLL